MATYYVTVKGYIKDGELKIDLPENVADGEIEVKVPLVTEQPATSEPADEDERPLTDEEIEELMRPEPKTGAEIAKNPAIGSWAHKGITDSVEWVLEQRRKRRERRGW